MSPTLPAVLRTARLHVCKASHLCASMQNYIILIQLCHQLCPPVCCIACPLTITQSLTLQRALAKSHQPPLISSIATDTASLYSSALQNIQAAAAAAAQQPGSSPIAAAVHAEVTSGAAFERLFSSPLPNLRWGASGRHVPKLLKYCQYQVCYCYAVAAVHSADASLAGSEAGTAVAWAQEASRAVKHVYSIGAEYDRLQPATSREQRQQLERTLDSKVQATLAK